MNSSTNARKAAGKGMRAILKTGILFIAGAAITTNLRAQQWEAMGPSTGISPSWGSFQHIAKDNSGNLYVSFYDGSVTKGSVMKYNGTSWSYLGGTAGITTGTATYNALAVAGNGDVFYSNQAGWPATGLDVRKFSGGAWTVLPQPETASVNYQAMVTGPDNQPYISFASAGTPVVKKYNGISWETVGTGLPAGTPTYLDMKAGSNDSIYISFVNGGLKVYKIHINASATDNWQEAGTTSFGATASEQFRSSMAIDAANNIYVAFTSPTASGNKINVKKYAAGVWSDVGSANFSDYRVHYVSIAIHANGTPFVAFSNFENSPNNKNSVMKYNGTQWELVGTAIAAGEAKWNALIIDQTGAPVLSYSDGSISAGGNMVKRFTTATGCTNTLPGNTTGDLGCVTFIYQGQPVTYTTVRAADGKVWLQQNLGSAAIATSKIDTNAYGHLFQWGRSDDGHQLRTSFTGPVPATNNPSGITAGTNTYFTGTGTAAWWNGGQLTDTWSGTTTSATNGVDPCKAIGADWHLPSQSEWADVVTDEAITNPDLAFGSNLKLTVSGSRSSSTGAFDFVGTRGYYWSSTTSSTGAKYYYFSAAVNNTGAGNTRGGGAAVRCIHITGTVSIADSVKVSTQNNVAATITTNSGTLQMASVVYPATVNQDVTWSIVAGTGTATISAARLVTALTNGTVWAKAVSVLNPVKADSMLVTISNQVINISGIDVVTANGVPAAISINAGTLQLQAVVLPANANQDVIWSVPATGTASINQNGLVSALSNGSVWAKAISVQNNTISDSLLITISNQVVPPPEIDSIVVQTWNNAAPVINTVAGTLQIEAIVYPNAANQNVTWSIVPATGIATVNAAGILSAQQNGSVWVKAVSVEDGTKSDSIQISITNQNNTGIQEMGTLTGFNIYPNPAGKEVFIALEGKHSRLDIILTDIYGRVVYTQNAPAQQSGSILKLNVQDINSGLYFITVKGNTIHLVSRLVRK